MNLSQCYSDGFRRAIVTRLLTAGMLFQAHIGWTQSSSGASTQELAPVGSRQIRAHDPSTIVKCGGEYWVFYTGTGIPSYHSRDLLKWEPGPPVFTNAPGWIAQAVPANRRMHYWAPDVIALGDRYLLYYSVSTFGKNQSAIGLATNPTLDPNDRQYRWTDQGIVIQSGAPEDFNAIDPAVFRDKDGTLWLAFGSFWSGIRMIQLDPRTGMRIAPDSVLYSLAHHDSIEASFLCRHDDYYYLFVDWDQCCRGTNSTYNIRVGRSRKVTGPYLDQSGVDMLADGGSLVLQTAGAFIGPGHAGIISAGGTNWFSCHFYDGTRGGASTLAILPLRWNANGWPEVEMTRANRP